MLKTIRAKIILLTLSISLVSLIVSNLYQLNSYRNDIKKEIEVHQEDLAEVKAEEIEKWIKDKSDEVDKIVEAHKEELLNSISLDNSISILQQIAKDHSGFEDIIYADVNGSSISDKGFKTSVNDRNYFQEAKNKNETIISDILISKGTGNKIVVFCKSIMDASYNVKGAFMVSVVASPIIEMINSIKFGQSGYGYLVNGDKNFIVHPNEKLLGKNLKDVESKNINVFNDIVFKGDKGFTEYIDNEKSKRLLVFDEIEITGWKIIITGNSSELFNGINKTETVVFIFIAAFSLIIIGIAWIFSRTISKPISGVIEVLQKTADLDLVYDKNMEYLLKYEGEIGAMTKSVFKTREHLRNIVNEINKVLEKVVVNSEELANTIAEVSKTIEGVAKATNDLAKGSTDLAQNVQDGAEKLDNLAEEINDVSVGTDEIREYIDVTKNANNNGIVSVEKLEVSVKENIGVADNVGEQVDLLEKKSELIGKITDAIKVIASQINLLSLNAAIEAARAGETGRGFAVVADEIRKLAHETEIETKEIESIVKDVKDEIGKTKRQMDAARSVIEKTKVASENTSMAFESIDSSAKDIINRIDKLISSIKAININKGKVVASMEDMSAIAEETASTTEQISSTTEEQSVMIEQVSGAAQNLELIAVELKNIVDKVKI